MKLTSHWRAAYAGALAAMIAASGASAAPLFVDTFDDTGSAAGYVVVGQTARSFPTFGWDYSAMGIPPAPNTTDGSTNGLKLDVNKGATPGAVAGLTLHTALGFTGNYVVKFDAWMNVNGAFPLGGSGSTRFLTAGVGGDGTTNNNYVTPSGSGGWTAVTGDGQNTQDYRIYKGTAQQAPSTGQHAAGNVDSGATGSRRADNPYYAGIGGVDVGALPVQGGVSLEGGNESQTGTSLAGAFGMKWQEVELHVDADGGAGGAPSMKWYISGLLIATMDGGVSGGFNSNGRVTLGFLDPSSNVAGTTLGDQDYNFALIDNLVVIPEPSSLALLGLAAAALVGVRRR